MPAQCGTNSLQIPTNSRPRGVQVTTRTTSSCPLEYLPIRDNNGRVGLAHDRGCRGGVGCRARRVLHVAFQQQLIELSAADAQVPRAGSCQALICALLNSGLQQIPKSGILIKFDRLSGAVYKPSATTYTYGDQYTAADLSLDVQRAMNGSNVLLSGSLFKSDELVPRCAASDWTITALSRESSSVIIYRPGDVSVYCDPNPPSAGAVVNPGSTCKPNPGPPTLGDCADWIQTGFIGDLNDPARKTPGAISTTPAYCRTPNSATKYANASDPATSIIPCDLAKGTNAVRTAYYHSGWIYNRLTVPSVWAGNMFKRRRICRHAGPRCLMGCAARRILTLS